MRLNVKFSESKHSFGEIFSEAKRSFEVAFNELVLVERTEIPKEYGLITYTQDRIITIT